MSISIDIVKEEDFNNWHIQYYQSLCFFANRLINNNFVAQEIVQDVFVKLWENRKVQEIQNMKAFLYTATRNNCINYLVSQKRKREKENETILNFPTVNDAGVLAELIRAEVLRELSIAIEQLPKQCKKVIRLIYEEGKNTNEIAEEIGAAPSTVRNHKARGLTLLRKILSKSAFSLLIGLL